MEYDSTQDTLDHIEKVQELLLQVMAHLITRATLHDASKLQPPEKEVLDKMTPKLSAVTYGSDEYKEMMRTEMVPMLRSHIAKNRHHPEWHEDKVDGMSLIDIVEMFCDWKAATLRHDDGDIMKSIEINQERHGLSPQLARIFKNTVRDLSW